MADLTAVQPPLARTRWLGPELAVVVAGVTAALLFPDDLGFITRINILAIFTLSLALVIGQAGIATLGQAAMFGAGSYSAALWAIHITPEPLSGVLIGALVGASVAAASGVADAAHARSYAAHVVGGCCPGAARNRQQGGLRHRR